MYLGLRDKAVIVTGAGRATGVAIVRAFAREGAKVVAVARDGSEELDRLSVEGTVFTVRADLGTSEGPAQMVEHALAYFGELDVLVNSLSTPTFGHGFLGVDDAAWERTFAVNFFSTVRACRAALPALVASGSGTIVNVTSVADQPDPRIVDFSAARAALANLSATLAMEFGPHGVRVNAVAPRLLPTGAPAGAGDIAARSTDTDQPDLSTETPAQTEVVASLVVMLASPRIGGVTGTTYVTDGGFLRDA